MIFRRGRRRQQLIDKRFQFKYALSGALYIVAIAFCLALPFVPLISTLQAALVDEPDHVIQLSQRQTQLSILTYALCTVWLAAAWILFSIPRSHKIAGPKFKLTRFMNGISAHNLDSRVSLRKNDELQDLAMALNGMLDRIQGGTPSHAGDDPKPSHKPAPSEELLPG